MGDLQRDVRQFIAERSISLCPTSLTSDYKQLERWISNCPVTEVEDGRAAMRWIFQQQPEKAARRVAMYLKCFYRWAASEDVGLVRVNPVQSFKFPKKPQSEEEVVVIPQDELPFVFAALERRRCKGAPWHLCARTMLQLGCRTGELFAIQVGDIHGDKLLVHQNLTLTHGLKHSTKTNKRRWVPLNPMVQEILEDLKPRAVDGFLFPWGRTAFQSFFAARMQELHSLGLISHRYRPYDLRHTAISRWLEAGISIAQVALWAGNTAEVIWKHYANVTAEAEMPVL